MRQITVIWGGEAETVELEPVAGSDGAVERGALGKHICIEQMFDGMAVAFVTNGPPEVLGMRSAGESAQGALDALTERVWKLAAWSKGVFAKPPQETCAACQTRIRTRRPDGRVRCRCGKSATATSAPA